MRDLWDKPWFSLLTKLTYSAYLNILWLICSLPIFTIGASTTALFYCTLKMAEDRDEGLTRMFFRAFRSNFKQSTLLFLVLFVPFALILMDLWLLLFSTLELPALMRGICLLPAILFFIALNYVYPLAAQFENTIRGTLKNALLLAIANLPISLVVLVLSLLPLIVFLFATQFFFQSLIVWFLIGFSLIAQCNAYLLLRVFRKYFPPDEPQITE